MQSVGIHDALNAQGFAMHHRAISNIEVFRYEGFIYFSVPQNREACADIKHGDPVGN